MKWITSSFDFIYKLLVLFSLVITGRALLKIIYEGSFEMTAKFLTDALWFVIPFRLMMTIYNYRDKKHKASSISK